MKSLTDMAADLNVPTEQVLTALRVVASRAGQEELANWAEKELDGYGEEDELPKHRCWELTISADLYNPLQAFVPDTQVWTGDNLNVQRGLNSQRSPHFPI